MTGITPHVFGGAQVWVGTGSAGALEQVGVTADSVVPEFPSQYEEVLIDAYMSCPVDLQYCPEWAVIPVTLQYYDQTIVDKLIARLPSGTPGVAGAAGTLMIAQQKFVRLCFKPNPNNTGEAPLNFPQAVLVDSYKYPIGTKNSEWQLTFRALPTVNVNDSTGAVLWNRVAT
jgi:hypothetical protein